MLRVDCSALLLVLSLTSLGAQAEGLKVTPGKWEVRITTKMPGIPQPIENVGTQCIADSEMKPDELLRDSGECTFSDAKTSGSKFSWAMHCKNEGGEHLGGEARRPLRLAFLPGSAGPLPRDTL